MGKKLTKVSWNLWDASGVHVVDFKSDQIYVWVTQQAVIVYDLVKKVGFAAIYSESAQIFEGEHRRLSVGDTVYAPDHTQWLWMTEEDKQEMIDLLRRVISTRRESLPGFYGEIWRNGVFQAKNLLIQKPGTLKHRAKYIPGLG